jgi:hypothetical protein
LPKHRVSWPDRRHLMPKPLGSLQQVPTLRPNLWLKPPKPQPTQPQQQSLKHTLQKPGPWRPCRTTKRTRQRRPFWQRLASALEARSAATGGGHGTQATGARPTAHEPQLHPHFARLGARPSAYDRRLPSHPPPRPPH